MSCATLAKLKLIKFKSVRLSKLILQALSVCLLSGCSSYHQEPVTSTSIKTHEQTSYKDFTFQPIEPYKFIAAKHYINPFKPNSPDNVKETGISLIDIESLYLLGIIYQKNLNHQTQPHNAAIVADVSHQIVKLVNGQKFNNDQWQVDLITDEYLVISEITGKNKKLIGFH